jgi:hypothetical protein
MKRQVILGAVLFAMALAVLAQDFTSKPLGAPTDQQKIEQLERRVSALEGKLITLEQRTSFQFRPLGNSK